MEDSIEGDTHHFLKITEPKLNFIADLDGLGQGNLLAHGRNHGLDFGVVGTEGDLVDTCKQLFQVKLNNRGVLSLTKNFQEILVTNEVKAGELLPLLFEEIIECFLALIDLRENVFQSVFQSGNISETHYFGIGSETVGNRPVVIVDASESALFLGKGTTHEDGLQVHPLTLNHVQFGQVVVNTTELLLELLDLILKAADIS